jgi:hypothetical protein
MNGVLTVPYSRYTADPVAATTAPSSHMVNAMPTLPADLKMTLGVAKILLIPQMGIARKSCVRISGDRPCANHPVED